MKLRLTTAQALVRFLACQYVERDGKEHKFFGGCFGILGHGNLGGIGQALQETKDLRFIPFRNEQAQVHAAIAYARMKNRMGCIACTSSIGPGATNMVTGAACATINRIPVLLLPGDIFARRNVAPVLQQLESEFSQDISVNDCFRPVSRYWDRIYRPEQLITSLLDAMRVLTSPSNTGTVTLCLPQDVQTEAHDFPAALFEKRVWHIPRPRPDKKALFEAVSWIRNSKRPLIIAGGGVKYSEAQDALARFCELTGIPEAETQAGKGSLLFNHPSHLGGVGVTGSLAANLIAKDCDLVIGIGTRYSDFTTASKTLFKNPDVRFININIAEMDSFKHFGLGVQGDAKVAIEELLDYLKDYKVEGEYIAQYRALKEKWEEEVETLVSEKSTPMSQARLIGILNETLGPNSVIINAAGSAPGDLHKLWRCNDSMQYHLEYGYSTMGYEIPAGIGAKMAVPDRDIVVLVGDGSFLMMPSELVTAVQEGLKITVVIVVNYGYASIGGLSESLGLGRFGTEYKMRTESQSLDGELLPLDFVKIAEGMGAFATVASDDESLVKEVMEAKMREGPSVIVVECDPKKRVGSYEAWWDVPIAQVSSMEEVVEARKKYELMLTNERYFLKED